MGRVGSGRCSGPSREKVNLTARSLAIFFQTAREWETRDRAGEMPLASGFARRTLQIEAKSRSRDHARAPPSAADEHLDGALRSEVGLHHVLQALRGVDVLKSAAALDMISALGLTDFRLEDAMMVGGV